MFKPRNAVFCLRFIVVGFFIVCLSNPIVAQVANNGIFFQAVARDASSNPAKDRSLYVETRIIQTTVNGTVVLKEVHKTTTDGAGVFNVSIGNGTRIGGTVSGLSTIEWAKGPYFLGLRIAIQPVSPISTWDYNKEWIDLGTSPFGTVPYALYAGNVAGLDEKLNISDTAKMLQPYAKAQTLNTVSALVNTKLNTADSITLYVTPYQLQSLRFDTAAIYRQLSLKANAADINVQLTGKEDVSNKSTNLVLDAASATKYPSVKSVKDYVDANIALNTTPDATLNIKGKIQLGGDLAGAGSTSATPMISTNAITTPKINDGAVTDAKIALGISPAKVGLGNVDNTSDANKPISLATQAALNTKANTADVTAALGLKANTSDVNSALALKANTSDVNTALGLKANTADVTVQLSGKEDISNKSTNLVTDGASNTKYPSVKSVKDYVDATVGAGVADATTIAKGKIQLGGDLAGPGSTAATPVISANAITTIKINDGAVTTAKITDAAVTTIKINDAAITTTKINDAAIITSKVADGSITDAKVAAGISASKVGLGNVDNTSDANKPVSTLQQAALSLKEDASNKSTDINADASSTTKYPAVKTIKDYVDATVGAGVADATTNTKGKIQLGGDLAGAGSTAATPVISANAITTSKINDGAVTDAKIASGISAAKVGLGNVDNTSDASKPISLATQAALNTKANTADVTAALGLKANTADVTVLLSGKEDVNNKSTDINADAASTSKYPAVKTIKDYVDATVSAGVADATSNTKGKIQLAGDLAGAGSTAATPVISANAITTSKINDGAVTTAKIADGAVTDAKIASGISPAKVGLGNVDNTSDASKPISLATQAALNTKANAADVDIALALKANTSDVNTALGLKANTADVTVLLSGKEDVNNKSTDINADAASTTKYPAVKTIKDYVDATVSAGVSDATANAKGKIQLAGDLAGSSSSAASPVISNNAITTVKINDGAVTTAKITDGNVTYAKIQNVSATDKVLGRVSAGAGVVEEISTTGSGNVVRATTPTLVTPNIGDATGSSLTVSGQLTSTVATGTAPFVVTSTTPVANLNIGGNAATVTTNANLTGPITSVGNTTSVASQTGTGSTFVMNNAPTLITPTLGVASATTINKVSITAPTTSATLTIADGKTLSVTNDATVSGTNTGDQTITLTGDVTGSGTGSFATTIGAGKVTNAMLAGSIDLATKVSGSLPIANGGTGAVTAAAALTNLGAQSTANLSTDIAADAASTTKYPAVKTIKDYVDGSISTNATPDATSSTKGKIQLAGDLAGSSSSAASPVISNNAITTVKINDGAVTTAKITDGNVTYAKIQNVSATDKVLGRVSAGAGVVEEISTTGSGNIVRATSPTLVTPALGAATATSVNGLSLSAQTTGFTIAGGTTSRTLTVGNDASVSGTNTGDQTISLTGDVIGSGSGSFAATIATNAVTYAKMQNVSATDRVLGRVSAGAGNVEEISTTGSGNVVRATSPTLVTPNIGSATGTSLNVSGQLTSTIATGTAPLVVTSTTPVANLSIGGNAATATLATASTNLAGGAAGSVPYQTAAGTTTLLSVGTNGHVLTLANGVPTWAAAPGISSVGTIGSLPNANGATITSGVLYLQPANSSFGGVVTTGTQAFAGDKTFNNDLNVNGVRVGRGNSSVVSSLAIGTSALGLNTTSGTFNTAVGYQNLQVNSSGTNNTAIGSQVLGSNVLGTYNIGIGTLSQNNSTNSGNNVSIGSNTLNSSSSSYFNVAIGNNALSTTSGVANVAVGHNAGINLDDGTINNGSNVFIGYDAGVKFGTGTGSNNVSSRNSIFIGRDTRPLGSGETNQIVIAGFDPTGTYKGIGLGSNSTSIGNEATTTARIYGDLSLPRTTTSISTTTGALRVSGGVGIAGALNVGGNINALTINGFNAGSVSSAGSLNTIFGRTAYNTTATGSRNLAMGEEALLASTSGSSNVALGYRSLTKTTSGNNNIAVGDRTLQNITASFGNIGIGSYALSALTGSNYTIAIGQDAGNNLTSGEFNTYIGAFAGSKQGSSNSTNTTSKWSVLIGYDTRGSADGNSNEIVISGYDGGSVGSIGLGTNTTKIGNSSVQRSQIHGALTVVPNNAPASTDGNSATFAAQNAGTGGNNNGGNINITTGNGTGVGTGGDVIINLGTSPNNSQLNGSLEINTTTNPLTNSEGTINMVVPASQDGLNLKSLANGNNIINLWQTGTTSSNFLTFYKGDVQTLVGSINVTTTGATYNTASDYRLKTDFKNFNGTALLNRIKVYDYQWKADQSRSYGVKAHELQFVIPYAVSGEKDAVNPDGSIKAQSVDYSKIVPILVKAMQEQEETLKHAQKENKSLKEQLEIQNKRLEQIESLLKKLTTEK